MFYLSPSSHQKKSITGEAEKLLDRPILLYISLGGKLLEQVEQDQKNVASREV